MRKEQSPLQRLRLRHCCPREKRYAPRYALNLKLPWAALGSLPLKLGMRRVIMRQPHSSLVILFQLEHGEDPATVRPLRAEVPVHPLRWFLSKNKYALGMRWTFFRPRTRLTYAPEVCARIKTLCSACVLPREKEVRAQVCAEPKGPLDCLGQSSFETGYAQGAKPLWVAGACAP